MKPGQIRYLQKLSSLETHEMKKGPWANDTYEGICFHYSLLRNYSKDFLETNSFTPQNKFMVADLKFRIKSLEKLTI